MTDTNLLINTHVPASVVINDLLQRSLVKLSNDTLSPGGDTGGMAVSMKLIATLHQNNTPPEDRVGDAVLSLKTHNGEACTLSLVLEDISELELLNDPLNRVDYDAEHKQLKAQLINLQAASNRVLGNESSNDPSSFVKFNILMQPNAAG